MNPVYIAIITLHQLAAATTARIIASVKAKAVEDVFKPATAIVDEVCVFSGMRYFVFRREFTASEIQLKPETHSKLISVFPNSSFFA